MFEGPYSRPTSIEGVVSKVHYFVGEENSTVGTIDLGSVEASLLTILSCLACSCSAVFGSK